MPSYRLTLKRFILWSGVLLLALFAFVALANYRVNQVTQGATFFQTETVPKNKVGLVLGTSKYLKSGHINPYFSYRIQSAVELYRSGKVDFLLVSGDNGSSQYNEPKVFKQALLEAGIPADKIVLDYAGFRTLDSVIRAKEVFGQSSITIISQKFHTERAVFLAKQFDIDAVGFNAKDVNPKFGLKVQVRELFARTKVFLDLLLGVNPKFLGEPVAVGE